MSEKDPQTIEIGCPPGNPRPSDLLVGVIEGTGLDVREPVSMSFGDWGWDYSDVDPEVWKKAKPVLENALASSTIQGSSDTLVGER